MTELYLGISQGCASCLQKSRVGAPERVAIEPGFSELLSRGFQMSVQEIRIAERIVGNPKTIQKRDSRIADHNSRSEHLRLSSKRTSGPESLPNTP